MPRGELREARLVSREIIEAGMSQDLTSFLASQPARDMMQKLDKQVIVLANYPAQQNERGITHLYYVLEKEGLKVYEVDGEAVVQNKESAKVDNLVRSLFEHERKNFDTADENSNPNKKFLFHNRLRGFSKVQGYGENQEIELFSHYITYQYNKIFPQKPEEAYLEEELAA